VVQAPRRARAGDRGAPRPLALCRSNLQCPKRTPENASCSRTREPDHMKSG
jgi:hypothetical protein